MAIDPDDEFNGLSRAKLIEMIRAGRDALRSVTEELGKALRTTESHRLSAMQANSEKHEAVVETRKTREQFADLKERLHNAEMENARLRGYLGRVHEDDIVRDGFVEIEDAQGKRSVPKRPNPLAPHQLVQHFFDNEPMGASRTHWTSY